MKKNNKSRKRTERIGKIERVTKETNIKVKLNIDGQGKVKINTGIGFLDHMLELFATHGLFDLNIEAKGDLKVDIHHTNEDVGIVLGQSFAQALAAKQGIRRFGFSSIPMDEALVRLSIDISNRPSLQIIPTKTVQSLNLPTSKIKGYSFNDAQQFLKSFIQHAGINMHIEIVSGDDQHHILEAIFKALARALDWATQIDPRSKTIPSSKGSL